MIDPTEGEAGIDQRLRALLREQSREVSAADAVHGALSRAITESLVPAGWRLSEERLAALFGVSRTPVREALARLASTNLVRRDERGSLRVETLTSEKILEVYAVRLAIDGLAAELAAQVSVPAVILELRHLNQECADAGTAGDFSRMAELNIEFHAAIARATRNVLLMQFLSQIHNWVRLMPSTTLAYPGRAAKAVEQHNAIIDAIAARDSQLAGQLARDHMREAESIRIAMLARRR